MNLLREFYRTHIMHHLPVFLRRMIGFPGRFLHGRPYLRGFEEQQLWALKNWKNFWKCTTFPFPWANEYDISKFPVYKDEDCDLFFVENHGMKLYFPNKGIYKDNQYNCQLTAMSLSIEQDLLSAHRYVSMENIMFGTIDRDNNEIPIYPAHFVDQGDIVADIGASNGNFSLSVIDNAKHVYLFEPNIIWNEGLSKTFEKYKEKITIINKYVSDIDSDDSITLNTFFKDKIVNFIKVDVDGYEEKILNGAKSIFCRENIGGGGMKCSICTYHRPQDERNFKKYFKDLNFDINFSDSYLFFPFDWRLVLEHKPQPDNISFFRKGVLMARKV